MLYKYQTQHNEAQNEKNNKKHSDRGNGDSVVNGICILCLLYNDMGLYNVSTNCRLTVYRWDKMTKKQRNKKRWDKTVKIFENSRKRDQKKKEAKTLPVEWPEPGSDEELEMAEEYVKDNS